LIEPADRDAPNHRRPRFFYGWNMVIASVATNTIMSAAYFQGFSALFLPIESYFAWPRWVISAALSTRQLESGIVSPLIGFMLVKITIRQMVFWSGVITAAGLIGLGLINGLFTFFLFFIIVSLGASGVSHAVTWPVLIARWFRRKRGLAMGLAVMGPIFGSPFLLLNTAIEETYGWRVVLIGYGFIVFVGVSLISMTIRNSPADIGLQPDGVEPTEEERSRGVSDLGSEAGMTLRQVLRIKEFWLLMAYMGGMFVVNSAMQAHQIPYFVEDRGLSSYQAAATLMLVFMVSAIGRIGGGYVMDRADYRVVLAVMSIVMGLALVYLQIFKPSSTIGSLPFIILFGIGFGSMIPIRGTLGSMMFGLRSLGPVIGLLQGGSVAAGVVGPIFLGVMNTFEGSYHNAIWALVVVSFIMAPVSLLMSSPKLLRERKAVASVAE
jgi:MFS family permease